MNTFAEKLKELREYKKLSMMDLAKQTNISDAAISRWENGQRNIGSEHLITLAKFFGVTTDYLLGLED